MDILTKVSINLILICAQLERNLIFGALIAEKVFIKIGQKVAFKYNLRGQISRTADDAWN
jgi:hypothetical protein